MTYFGKDINSLEETDLQWLIDAGYAEASVMEYKSKLSFDSNEGREKVLSQVSSFANAKGGDLIYGIATEKGVPTQLEGHVVKDADGLVLQIDNVIRTGIHPRLSSYVLRPVALASGNYAFVFRVQQSWNRPHQLRFNNKHLFYTRSSNGLAQIDVEDLRNLFVGAHDVKQRIEDFRQQRIADLLAGVTPVGVVVPPIATLHFVPLSHFANGELFSPLVFSHSKDTLVPMSRPAFNSFHNFEGYVVMSNGEQGADFYIQGFRDLRIEAVLGEYSESRANESPILPQTQLANELFMMVDNALEFYRAQSVPLPIIVMFTLVGAKGLKFRASTRTFASNRPLDRDVLQLPAILVDDFNVEGKRLLKPVLDILWQSAGFIRCFDYNSEGNWIGDKS